MTSRSDLHVFRACAAALLVGCGLAPTPRPAPLDCSSVDRAAERFPDVCGEDETASSTDGATPDAGSGR